VRRFIRGDGSTDGLVNIRVGACAVISMVLVDTCLC
jgi:hypothetical protein